MEYLMLDILYVAKACLLCPCSAENRTDDTGIFSISTKDELKITFSVYRTAHFQPALSLVRRIPYTLSTLTHSIYISDVQRGEMYLHLLMFYA